MGPGPRATGASLCGRHSCESRSHMTARQSDFTPIIDLLREKGDGPGPRTTTRLWRPPCPPCKQCLPGRRKTCKPGSIWPRPDTFGGPGRPSWRITRSRPFTAGFAITRAEAHCSRGQLDSAVSIHAVERFLGDLAAVEGWPLPAAGAASGKRILVVGGGPSGLSAAYHLARRGHAVEIREAGRCRGACCISASRPIACRAPI